MNFGIVDDFICDIDANGNVIDKVCEAVYVEKRLVNLLTWEIKCLITLIVRGNRITFPVKRADLLNGLPNELFAKGLSLANDKEVREAVHILILDTEMDAPDEFFHEKLGFCEVQDKLVFLANKPIGQLSAPQDSSEYKDPETGNADKVKPHGSFDAWLDLVRSEVLGHPNMELALLIGLSAPVAYILREKLRLFQEIPIWSIIGESSSGKTTALRVMASPSVHRKRVQVLSRM